MCSMDSVVMISVQFEAVHHRKDQLGTTTNLFLNLIFWIWILWAKNDHYKAIQGMKMV